MNAKTITFLLVGMCFSFTLVLGLMLTLFEPSSPPPTRRPLTRRARSQEAAATAHRPKPRVAPGAEIPADALVSGPAVQLPVPGLEEQRLTAPLQESELVSEETSRQIQLIRKVLTHQISVLEKERNQMLTELARRLKGMSAGQAAGELKVLDDETATLVLKKIPRTQRRSILEQLPPQRARRLRL